MTWFIRAYICQWTDESQFVSPIFKEVSKLPLEKSIQMFPLKALSETQDLNQMELFLHLSLQHSIKHFYFSKTIYF